MQSSRPSIARSIAVAAAAYLLVAQAVLLSLGSGAQAGAAMGGLDRGVLCSTAGSGAPEAPQPQPPTCCTTGCAMAAPAAPAPDQAAVAAPRRFARPASAGPAVESRSRPATRAAHAARAPPRG